MKAGGRKIALYLSGRRHAGENLAELLTKRDKGLTPPIQMSDALAANTSVEKNVISAYCLAHARRKVFELKEDYPEIFCLFQAWPPQAHGCRQITTCAPL